MGGGISQVNGISQINKSAVQPGDVGYIKDPHQHHCIVVKVNDTSIISVDGNTTNPDHQCYQGVWRKSRSAASFDGFFRVTALP